MAIDWQNALSGGATGAGIGAAGGPWGALAGGALGATAGLFGFGKNKKKKIKEYQNFSPEQQALIDEAVAAARAGNQDALAWIQSILSDEEGAFEAYEKPAMEQFQQEIVPEIIERVGQRGMGKGGSALNQTLGQAAKGLSTNLAAQRAQLKQNAIEQLNRFSNLGLTRKTTPYTEGGEQGAWGMLAPFAGQGAYDLLSSFRKQTPSSTAGAS